MQLNTTYTRINITYITILEIKTLIPLENYYKAGVILSMIEGCLLETISLKKLLWSTITKNNQAILGRKP